MDRIQARDWIDENWGPRRVHQRGPEPPPRALADDPPLHRWLVRSGWRKRVTCRFRGMLANQIYQVAATISHARRIGGFAFLPPWAYSRVFDCRIPTGLSTEGMELFEEDKLGHGALGSRSDVILRGNFQSLDYFDIPLVRRTLRFHPLIIRHVREQYRDLLATRPASIHVRRGDTLNPDNHMRVLPPQYYDLAIERLPDVQTFAVFSDDIPWCRERFRGPQFTFIDGEENFVDLCLMSLCSDHIICNSTFSWWGAWLEPHPGKRVITPGVWFKPEFSRFDSPNRIPPDWIVLEP